jgi:uncharacterized protein
MEQQGIDERSGGGGHGRLQVLDLIRGVAVLGILPVNMSVFSGLWNRVANEGEDWTSTLLNLAVMLVFECKMMTMLAILFGVGLAIQAEQARARGKEFAPYGRRRMLVLFCLGVGHALLLFEFDILASYGVAGLLALLFLQRGDRVLLRAAALGFTWSLGLMLLITAIVTIAAPWLESLESLPEAPEIEQASPTADTGDWLQEAGDQMEKFFDEENITRMFRSGSFNEIVLYRGVSLGLMTIFFWMWVGWYVVACMLLGAWLFRRGGFQDGSPGILLSGCVRWGAMAAALLLHLGAAIIYIQDSDDLRPWCLLLVGGLPLALWYLEWMRKWSASGRGEWLQARLRAVGRMSLSNYLMQSVLCGLVFYGYGFGQYGQMSTAATLGVVLAIWVLQFFASPAWLQRFRQGPAEWLWRRLSRRKELTP